MRLSELVRSTFFGGVLAAAFAGTAGNALAFDEKMFDESGGVKAELQPLGGLPVRLFGLQERPQGSGNRGALVHRPKTVRWARAGSWRACTLRAMASTATITEEAFKFYSEIAEQDVDPGSPEESYMSDALVALGSYLAVRHSGNPGRSRSERRAGLL